MLSQSDENIKTIPFLVLNSSFTNNLLTFTPLFRGRVKDLHFQVIVPSSSFKFAYDPNIKMGDTAIERYFIRYKR